MENLYNNLESESLLVFEKYCNEKKYTFQKSLFFENNLLGYDYLITYPKVFLVDVKSTHKKLFFLRVNAKNDLINIRHPFNKKTICSHIFFSSSLTLNSKKQIFAKIFKDELSEFSFINFLDLFSNMNINDALKLTNSSNKEAFLYLLKNKLSLFINNDFQISYDNDFHVEGQYFMCIKKKHGFSND